MPHNGFDALSTLLYIYCLFSRPTGGAEKASLHSGEGLFVLQASLLRLPDKASLQAEEALLANRRCSGVLRADRHSVALHRLPVCAQCVQNVPEKPYMPGLYTGLSTEYMNISFMYVSALYELSTIISIKVCRKPFLSCRRSVENVFVEALQVMRLGG